MVSESASRRCWAPSCRSRSTHQHGQRRAVRGDLGGSAAGRQRGGIGGAPVGVHVRLCLWNPLTDSQAGIAERRGQCLSHAGWAGRPAERYYQVGDRGPGPPDAHQADQQRDRHAELDDGHHRALRGGLRLGQRRLGVPGRLAAANLAASARRLSPVVSSLVLAVALGGSLWFLQTSIQHAAAQQSRAGLVADQVITTAGAGLPAGVAQAARHVPGVAAAASSLPSGLNATH